MRKINFEDVEVSYFLSTGEKVGYEYKEGVVFVRGENRTTGLETKSNGSGKTALVIDPVMFALFGVTSRSKFQKKDIPFNKGGKKKCYVNFNLTVEDNGNTQKVNIHRQLNPSQFILTVDGEDVSQSSAPSTQDYLVENILGGIRQDVFQKSIAMKINESTPFFSMGKPEREKFIGGIFDLTYLKDADKLARDEYNLTSKEASKKSTQVSSKEPQIGQIKNQIAVTKKELETKVSNKKSEIDVIQGKIDNFNIPDAPKEISLEDETKKLNKALRLVQDELDEFELDEGLFTRSVMGCKYDIKSKTKEISDKEGAKICPTCKREFDEECLSNLTDDISVIKEELVTLNEKLVREEDILKRSEEGGSKLRTKISKIQDIKNSLAKKVINNQKDISNHNDLLRQQDLLDYKKLSLITEIDEIENSSILKTLLLDYKKTQKELVDLKNELKVIEEELDVLNNVKILFGEKGMRSVILSKLVTLVNQSLAKYLTRLETPCKIEFDSDFDYVMTTLGGVEIPFDGLSGGEKLRVTTALAFTFKDILRIQNQITFNVSIYDEWFDASMDSRGLEILSDILKERYDNLNESAYVISHRTDLKVEGSHEMVVLKEDGVTRIDG